jgi:hypothetical protein
MHDQQNINFNKSVAAFCKIILHFRLKITSTVCHNIVNPCQCTAPLLCIQVLKLGHHIYYKFSICDLKLSWQYLRELRDFLLSFQAISNNFPTRSWPVFSTSSPTPYTTLFAIQTTRLHTDHKITAPQVSINQRYSITSERQDDWYQSTGLFKPFVNCIQR